MQREPKKTTDITREVAAVCLSCDLPRCSGEWSCYNRRKKILQKAKKSNKRQQSANE